MPATTTNCLFVNRAWRLLACRLRADLSGLVSSMLQEEPSPDHRDHAAGRPRRVGMVSNGKVPSLGLRLDFWSNVGTKCCHHQFFTGLCFRRQWTPPFSPLSIFKRVGFKDGAAYCHDVFNFMLTETFGASDAIWR